MEELGSDWEGLKFSCSVLKGMLVIDIFLYGIDFVKSSYRKMFLEEFR